MLPFVNRDKVIQLRVTEEEQTRYKAAAASENLGLSEWVRKHCEGLTQPPVVSRGHPRRESSTPKNEKPKSVPVAPVAGAGASPAGLLVCSRTGFPVEACLCPQCKKLK